MAHAEAEKQFPWFKWFYEFTKPYADQARVSHKFIVAQGTKETGWGKGSGLLEIHNLFGITGPKGPNTKKIGDLYFLKFSSFEECMDHYIDMFKTDKNYPSMRNPEVRSDPKKAAEAIKMWDPKNPTYSQEIIDLMVNPEKGKTFREFFTRCEEGLKYKQVQGPDEAPNYVPGVAVPSVTEEEPLPKIDQVWGG